MMHEKIIIIGAGISGLVCGILLQQAGVQVEIFEQRASVNPIGGGFGLWPNGTQVLLSLPCADKIFALAAKITHDRFGDANGNTLAIMSRDIFQNINGFPVLNICRSELHDILLTEFDRENIHFEKKLISIQNTENQAIAFMENGDKHIADLIIGADGIYSAVRKNILPHINLHYTGYIQLLGILRGPDKFDHHFVWGKNRYSIVFPIADKRCLIYQALPYEANTIKKLATRQDKIALFRGWAHEVDSVLDVYEKSLSDPDMQGHFFCDEAYYSEPFTPWYAGRTVLIGDAAHPMGSIYGLAANVALEDTHALVDFLQKEMHVETALIKYQQFQQPRATGFFQLEQAVTQFLLHADEKEYNDFLFAIKSQPAEIFNQQLISLLQRTYKNVEPSSKVVNN